ncbi:MAG: LysM peptidoglycan-binding domain-containing protein [Nitrospirae bacterium]|nr:LysM peptidoglycan-binding domain-containing protein [Nitrospirota bacterium]
MEAKSCHKRPSNTRSLIPLFITYTILYTITCTFVFYFGAREAGGASVQEQDFIGDAYRKDSAQIAPTPSEEGSNDVRQYTVVKGDTVYRLCVKHYTICKSRELELIKKYNPDLTNVDYIQVGQVLRFPVFTPEAGVFGGKERQQERQVAKERQQGHGKERGLEQCTVFDRYPSRLDGSIDKLEWINDGRARVYGHINGRADSGGQYKFYVSVPGDLDYEQPMVLEKDGTFNVDITVGRAGKDYGVNFGLKLAKVYGDTVVSDITRHTVKDPSKTGVEYFKAESSSRASAEPFTGPGGVAEWVRTQSLDAGLSDNPPFKVKDGIFVKNYRYISANPDERYLARYGRVTLYGSSVMAKALILQGRYDVAERILKVWVSQVNLNGMVPRSANTVGDNYVSPDVTTGDAAHFIGALAMLRVATHKGDYDDTIIAMFRKYFLPLQDAETGLVRGGYRGSGDGYGPGNSMTPIKWASTEHNVDLFQSLVLLSKTFKGDISKEFSTMYEKIGSALDKYMWDDVAGTFNRGYRFETGRDEAKALDCASWGVLYLVKQAELARDAGDKERERIYSGKAKRALGFIENNFVSRWCYETPAGRQGVIRGYKPYAGKIMDVTDEATNEPVDWNSMDDFVWSEGTLGVAMANHEFCRFERGASGSGQYCARSDKIINNMRILQSLSDKGGMLYATKNIKGNFTMAEELSALSWYSYALFVKSGHPDPNVGKIRTLIPW